MQQNLQTVTCGTHGMYKRLTIMCDLERVVKGLGNLWEMFAKGEFSDDMGKVHDYEAYWHVE